MCIGADEAHYKRHLDIAERVRSVYESCGEDWTIIPSEEPERGRSRARDSDDTEEDDRSSTSGETAIKRKERKEQRRLLRAASRPKVVTQDEIAYIESVLHPAAAKDDAEGPSNPEEVEEIEKNLRYNAQVYNTGSKRGVLREFARIPDADVDFEEEMDRILETFRIAELIKRNTRNRGLQGKELRHFETSIRGLKERIVEDLVLLKRDEMEVRMRRAAFLRYTNRASFDIVEKRYAKRDWRTGQKLSPPTTDSASSGTLISIEEEEDEDEEEDEGDGGEDHQNDLKENISHSVIAQRLSADHRHLKQEHKQVGRDGYLEEVMIVQRSPTREPTKLQRNIKKPPAQLRLIVNNSKPQDTPSPKSGKLSKIYSTSTNRRRDLISRQMAASSHGKLIHTKDNDGWDHVSRVPQPVERLPVYTKKANRESLPLSTRPTAENRWSYLADDVAGDDPELEIMDMEDVVLTSDEQRTDEEEDGFISTDCRTSRAQIVEPAQVPEEAELTHIDQDPQQPPNVSHDVGQSKKIEKKKRREAERKSRRAEEKAAGARNKPPVLGGIDIDRDQSIPSVDCPIGREVEEAENVKIRGESSFSSSLRLPENAATTTSGEAKARLDSAITYGDKASIPIDLSTINNKHLRHHGAQHIKLIEKAGIKDEPVSDGKIHTPSSLVPSLKPVNVPGSSCQRLLPVTKIARHDHWLKYASFLRLDGPSVRDYTAAHSCREMCMFGMTKTVDCPFHEAHCKCCDPLADLCFLVYPNTSAAYASGPFNRLRAQKLLTMFENLPETKGRMMLVDDDIVDWVIKEGRDYVSDAGTGSPRNMPTRLLYEFSEWLMGYGKGELMLQAEQYNDMARHNDQSNPSIDHRTLRGMQKNFESGKNKMCYCYGSDADQDHDNAIIECSFNGCRYKRFHLRCVNTLGIDRVSRWYCTDCEQRIADVAKKVLDEVDSMRRLPRLSVE